MAGSAGMTGDSAADLDAHPVHRIPPVGAPYVLGRWHHDRATWRGYAFEARVWAKSLVRRNPTARFLMLGRPRSGTTLLYRLLDQVPGLHCDGEVLHHAVLAPRAFLNRLAGIKSSPLWGAKLLSYQMFEMQRIPDHRAFLAGLVADGFRLIHIRRDTWEQSLSLSLAQETDLYHIRAGEAAGETAEGGRLRLDPARMVAQIRWNLAMLDYEDRLLAPLPHLVVDYGRDLARPEAHQSTVERICAFLGHPAGPVRADLERTGGRTRVENMDEIRAALTAAGLGHVLPPLPPGPGTPAP
jgi:hypothetical protein